MKFQFTFKGMDPTGAKGVRVHGHAEEAEEGRRKDPLQQRMKELVTEKTQRRFDRVVSPEKGTVTVVITREKNNWLLLEMTMKALGDTFMSSDKIVETGTNLDQLVDSVLDKIERQLLKRKEMLKERWKQRSSQA